MALLTSQMVHKKIIICVCVCACVCLKVVGRKGGGERFGVKAYGAK